jgi:phthiodiolone/phenolphthiodiolone dimycocerosates ketoreductase
MLRAVTSAERMGFDAVWWSDHWMGWFPDGVWDPKRFDIATRHSSPHVYLDAMVAIAAAAMHTSSVRLGTAVSDPIRRHPVALATEALSAARFERAFHPRPRGRGGKHRALRTVVPRSLGAGSKKALELIRLLWSTHEHVSFSGSHFELKDAGWGSSLPEGPPQSGRRTWEAHARHHRPAG